VFPGWGPLRLLRRGHRRGAGTPHATAQPPHLRARPRAVGDILCLGNVPAAGAFAPNSEKMEENAAGSWTRAPGLAGWPSILRSPGPRLRVELPPQLSCPRLNLSSPGGVCDLSSVGAEAAAVSSWEQGREQLGAGSLPANKMLTATNCAGPGDFRPTPSLQTQPRVSNRNCNANIYSSSPPHTFKRETLRHQPEPVESCARFPLALLRPSERAAAGSPSSFGCASPPALGWKSREGCRAAVN